MRQTRLLRVVRVPGIKRLLSFALIAELPNGMTALAIVLRVTQAGGSYARAGLIGGVGALGIGISAPIWSRLIDRRGQTLVLVPTAVAVTASAFVLAVLPPRGAILPLLLASLAMGLTQPPAMVSARTLWPKVVHDPLLLETTYSVESSMNELIFIVGPLLAIIVNAAFGPVAAVAGSGLLAGIGALGLATSHASRRTHGRRETQRSRGALHSAAVRLLVVTVFMMVIAFASIDVSTVAAARRDSGNGAAGVLIAVWGIGSMIGGLAFGARSWAGRRSTKILVFVAGITALTAALVPLSNLAALGVVLFVGGLMYAPCFSCINQAVQRSAIAGAATESFAWVATGVLVGAAIGSTAGGYAVTDSGLVVAMLVVFAGRRSLRAGDQETDAEEAPLPTAAPA